MNAFEQWVKSPHVPSKKNYKHLYTQGAWDAWQHLSRGVVIMANSCVEGVMLGVEIDDPRVKETIEKLAQEYYEKNKEHFSYEVYRNSVYWRADPMNLKE